MNLNKYITIIPVQVPIECITRGSFIELLFNDDDWNFDTYKYKFKKLDKFLWPEGIRYRLSVGQNELYIPCDTTDALGINLFKLKDDDHDLLKRLVDYRLDGTCVLSDIVFDYLQTNLSRLIYGYLDFSINKSIDVICNYEPILDSSVLDSLYEVYIYEKVFRYISSRGS